MGTSEHEMTNMSGLDSRKEEDGMILTPVLQHQPASAPILGEDGQELPVEAVRSTWRVTLILIALFLSLFVAALDATIIATAVPIIAHDLDSAAGYVWVGGSYLLANCAAGPIFAKLSDIWGRKPLLMASLALFMTGSIICAVSRNMSMLIAGRAVQGAAGGCMIMLVHICISDIFSVRRRSLILGLTEGVWACAGGIGPILGGVFASLVSWRWCFWVNLPICGVAFILILVFLDVKHESTSFSVGIKAVDWFGIAAFLGFTLMVLLGLDFGGAIFPWSSAKVVALLVVGFIFIFVFIYGEARMAKYPLMPLGLFSERSNVASLMVTFFHGLVFMNTEYYLPLFLQSVLGATPVKSGVLLLPYIVCSAIGGSLGGVVTHRTGRYVELIWLGTFLLCIGSGLYIIWDVNTSIAKIVGFLIIGGVGSGLLFSPPLLAIQAQVRQEDVTTAISTFSFVRNIALSICVVIGGAIFQNSMDHQQGFLEKSGITGYVLEQLSGKNAAANVMISKTLSDPAQALAVRQAFAWSIRNMFITFTVLGFFAFVSGLFVKKSHLAQEHTETVTGIRSDSPDKR